MLSDEEKNSMELDIEAKYVGRTEKEFLNNITYAECLYILDTKNKYCDDIKNLSLIKIEDIVNEQSKEIEELKDKNKKLQDKAKELIFEKQELTSALLDSTPNDKIKSKIEELEKEQEDNRKVLYNAVNNLYFKEIDIISNKISVNMSIRDILQSLLEKE